MRVAEFIDSIWFAHGNHKGLSYGKLAVLFISHMIHSLNYRLYGVEQWVMKHKTILEQSSGWKIGDKDATDDRLGDMLEELGGNDEKSLYFQKKSVKYLIQAYELPTKIARYDTTSFSVHHSPDKNKSSVLKFGHSKDKRPDLLQFKQGIGVLDPAGVPLITETLGGNEADDPRHVPAWREMAKIIGHKEFLYVADSKAAALETRATIDKKDGSYLFPLPMTGNTPEALKNLVVNPPSKLEEIRLEDKDDDEKAPIIGRGFVVEKKMEA